MMGTQKSFHHLELWCCWFSLFLLCFWISLQDGLTGFYLDMGSCSLFTLWWVNIVLSWISLESCNGVEFHWNHVMAGHPLDGLIFLAVIFFSAFLLGFFQGGCLCSLQELSWLNLVVVMWRKSNKEKTTGSYPSYLSVFPFPLFLWLVMF